MTLARRLTTILGALVVAAVLLTVITGRRAQQPAAARPSFVPDPHNDKVLLTRGWTTQELNKIIDDFVALYGTQVPADFATEVHADPTGALRAVFPHDVPGDLFIFLVNYVRYPRGIDLKGRAVYVAGRATLTSGFGAPHDALGQKAILYVPTNDTDYDVVYVRTVTGMVYEDSFASDTWKRVDNPRLPPEVETLQ